MEQFQEIINLLRVYLQNAVVQNGFWDNVVEYWIPILSVLFVITGGVFTLYTYIKGKNREINEKVLGEVYSPMYQFFVKNDALTDLAEGDVDYKEEPLLEWKRRKTEEIITDGKHGLSVKAIPVLELSRKDFVKMLDSVNMGLAPQELITLFNIYKSANFAADETGEGAKSQRANEYRTQIEYAIRKHAYIGYMKYCKKLGIEKKTENKLFDVKEDCIKLKLPILKEYENKDER